MASTDAELYETMLRIRRFEERVVELVNADEISGVTHEYVGQEAVAVGVCAALVTEDVITSTHRGHGHVIAKGGRESRMLAELLGRVDGYNAGRGGSMHIADYASGMYGANGIVGAGVPIACGAAFAMRRSGRDNVAVAFFGDGGINQGVVLESLNLAAIWSLPVVFVCENNQYAQTTPVGEANAAPICGRAEGAGIPSVQVDGMDVHAVADAAAEAVSRARVGRGPTFLECLTYRFVGHQTAERHMRLRYREDAEIEQWRLRDPLLVLGDRMRQNGWSDERLAEIDVRVARDLDEATRFARASAWPDPSTALDHMYAVEYPGLPATGVQ
jgi:acetoin:2,6-dichlorophenolindophenol oxidoreductase subunit alpha